MMPPFRLPQPVAQAVARAVAHPFAPAGFFFAGVTWDAVTLTEIDYWLDDVILLAYFVVVGALIVLTARAGHGPRHAGAVEALGQPTPGSWESRARPYYPAVIHFFMGSLFSAQSIFYLHSASLSTTSVFLVMLVGLLVTNEFLLERVYGLHVLIALYTVVCFSFVTFMLPVMTGRLNTAIFLLGAVLTVGIALGLVHLVHLRNPDRSWRQTVLAGWPAPALVGILVGFYFLNWIPPVPLSLKSGGLYHQVTKRDGAYELQFERSAWYQFWKRSDDPFHGEGPAYCFTAVYAPLRLHGTIYHRWQRRQPNGEFVQTDRIGMAIAGGREGGYRGYTVKQRLDPGDWRVDVETAEGRLIGRVSVRVEPAAGPLEWATIVD